MPAFLAPMATRLVLVLLALAAVLGVVVYIWYLRDAAASARQAVLQSRSTIAQLVADNQADLAALAQIRAQNALWQASLAASQSRDAIDRQAADGVIGPETLAAMGNADPMTAATTMLTLRLEFMVALADWPRFAGGWGRRLVALAFFAAGQ